MKTSLAVIAALALSACATVSPPLHQAATCSDAGEGLGVAVLAEANRSQGPLTGPELMAIGAIAATVTKACLDTGWTPAARDCYAGIKSDKDSERCRPLLTWAQKTYVSLAFLEQIPVEALPR